MGMICNMLRVSEEELQAFKENSALLEDLVYSDDAVENEKLIDIDKSWDGINFMLTGHGISTIHQAEPPLSQVIFTGKILDEEQGMGYGPAHYAEPELVTTISYALNSLSLDSLKLRYDASSMNQYKIYPGPWAHNDEEIDYLIDYLVQVKTLYNKASEAREAIIIYLS